MDSKTIISGKLAGIEIQGVRQLQDLEIEATFDSENAEASIMLERISFVGQANQKLLELFETNPLEAPEFIPEVSHGGLVANQKYGVDFRTLRILSPEESEVTLIKDNGSPSFEELAEGFTMQLAKNKGILTSDDWVEIPYIVENRKRLLEFLTLQIELVSISKSIFDEVFKLVNIVSDIASGAAIITIPAAIIAGVNLGNTITQLIILTVQFIKLIIQTQKLLFPPIRYHLGINVFNWLEKGCNYFGYDLEVGPLLDEILRFENICGSKHDEVGPSISPLALDPEIKPTVDQGDGLLSPGDFGYTLGEMIRYVKLKFGCRAAIKDGVYHLRPRKDPFWYNSPAITIPDVLIEQALGYSNGYKEYNSDELSSRDLIYYQKDESDYHTISDVNNRMAEVIYDSNVSDKKRDLLRGYNEVELPYALCVRKPEADNLFTKIIDIEKLLSTYESELQKQYDKYPILEKYELLPAFAEKPTLFFIKKGALLVENHFFSKAKVVYLDPETGRIPENFTEKIGADALWTNFLSWGSMAKGQKDPDNPEDTAQKTILREVKIPFNSDDYQQTIDNSTFNSPTFGQAEFLSLRWKPGRDHATADFYIFKNWIPNLTAKLYKLGPTATEV